MLSLVGARVAVGILSYVIFYLRLLGCRHVGVVGAVGALQWVCRSSLGVNGGAHQSFNLYSGFQGSWKSRGMGGGGHCWGWGWGGVLGRWSLCARCRSSTLPRVDCSYEGSQSFCNDTVSDVLLWVGRGAESVSIALPGFGTRPWWWLRFKEPQPRWFLEQVTVTLNFAV